MYVIHCLSLSWHVGDVFSPLIAVQLFKRYCNIIIHSGRQWALIPPTPLNIFIERQKYYFNGTYKYTVE